MATPAVTYSFAGGTTILAGQVNTNFTDLISCLTDGLKDFTISTLAITSVTATGAVQGSYFLPTGDDATAPGANYLYKANVPKGWAYLTCGAGGAVTVTNGHNIASAAWAADVLTVTIDTNMADANYAPLSMSSVLNQFLYIGTVAAGTFEVKSVTSSTGVALNWADTNVCLVSVFGDQ